MPEPSYDPMSKRHEPASAPQSGRVTRNDSPRDHHSGERGLCASCALFLKRSLGGTPRINTARNGSGTNEANYLSSVRGTAVYSVTQSSSHSGTRNYLTHVGAFSSCVSAYGTWVQSGNAFEWNDRMGAASSSRGLRGGLWDYDS